MASFIGETFWRYVNMILRRPEAQDVTIESRLGEQWDALCQHGRRYVEESAGKPIVQTITLTLKVKTFKNDNGEYINEIAPNIKGVIPSAPLPTKHVYLDRDGVAHTVAVQVDLPIMGIKGSVEGGKQDNAAKPAVKLG